MAAWSLRMNRSFATAHWTATPREGIRPSLRAVARALPTRKDHS